MYEAVLGSSGLMQIGWCTTTCKFTREEGVGDTANSYAFDGYREAKWNSRENAKYGEVLYSFIPYDENFIQYLSLENISIDRRDICINLLKKLTDIRIMDLYCNRGVPWGLD